MQIWTVLTLLFHCHLELGAQNLSHVHESRQLCRKKMVHLHLSTVISFQEKKKLDHEIMKESFSARIFIPF